MMAAIRRSLKPNGRAVVLEYRKEDAYTPMEETHKMTLKDMRTEIESMGFEESVAFTESQIALFTLTEDAKEGQQAFQQKRKPQWKNR